MLYLWCICIVFLLYLFCICVAFVLYLCCICILYLHWRQLQRNCVASEVGGDYWVGVSDHLYSPAIPPALFALYNFTHIQKYTNAQIQNHTNTHYQFAAIPVYLLLADLHSCVVLYIAIPQCTKLQCSAVRCDTLTCALQCASVC